MPRLNAGNWHGCFSWNMERGRAGWVRAVNLAAQVRAKLAAIPGVEFADAPESHQNPEPTRREVNGTGRDVWSVDVWLRTTLPMDSIVLDTAVTTALRDAGAGTDVDVAAVAERMGSCTAPALGGAGRGAGAATLAVRSALGVYAGFGPELAFGTVCSSYEAFTATPPAPAVIDGPLGRLAAGPVLDSNNASRIGRSDPVFTIPGIDLGVSPLAVKVTLGVVGGVVVLGVIGYATRGVSGLVREVK